MSCRNGLFLYVTVLLLCFRTSFIPCRNTGIVDLYEHCSVYLPVLQFYCSTEILLFESCTSGKETAKVGAYGIDVITSTLCISN